jgi:hypothetical protein
VEYHLLEAADPAGESGPNGAAGQGWQLSLLPKVAPLDRLITELRISGTGRMTETLEVLEATGDRSLTRILDPDPTRRFDPEERRRLFGTAAP